MESKKGLFSFGDVKNHPHRSGFDLSARNAFTAKAGELLPVYSHLCLPGDKLNLKHVHFTRTQPLNTSAFTTLREYYDWYFVPLRLLNKNLPQALVQMVDNPVTATGVDSNRKVITDLPWTSMETVSKLFQSVSMQGTTVTDGNLDPEDFNALGFRISATSAKLFSFLDYGAFLNNDDFSNGGSVKTVDGVGLSKLNVEGLGTEYFLRYSKNLDVNLLPLFAYQKIYSDYFRFSQWEKSEPFTFNFDYYTGGNILGNFLTASIADRKKYMRSNNLFTMRYANWHKDMFMGVMPSPQLGSVATIDSSLIVDGTVNSYVPVAMGAVYNSLDKINRLRAFIPNGSFPQHADVGYTALNGASTNAPVTVSGSMGDYGLAVDSASVGNLLSSAFSVIQLRIAEATQRWKEISQCADQNYRDQIYAHFGVRLSGALSDSSMYLGGSSHDIAISEVVNQSLNGESDAAVIKGKGVGSGQSFDTFTASEHGVLMCIYHAVPLLDYAITAPSLQHLWTSVTDLPIPEFDSIGMESLPMLAFLNDRVSASHLKYDDDGNRVDLSKLILGYVPRYIAQKTKVDRIHGAFLTSLRDWVAPVDPAFFAKWLSAATDVSGNVVINYNFFKVNPSVLDNLFLLKCDSTWDTDQFIVNSFFDVKSVSNLDYSGMPY